MCYFMIVVAQQFISRKLTMHQQGICSSVVMLLLFLFFKEKPSALFISLLIRLLVVAKNCHLCVIYAGVVVMHGIGEM